MEVSALSQGDPSSYSTPELIVVTHIHLALGVDFTRKILLGKAILTLERRTEGSKFLSLDAKELRIDKITDNETGAPCNYALYQSKNKNFGSRLNVTLPDSENGSSTKICIEYQTAPTASGLQWLTPQQTAGKSRPYLFSQCQAIHCRSMIPCQDTPAVKMTYSAEIRAPADLMVLMSAMREGEPEELDEIGCLKLHRFRQDVPVPSYLIAIAVGALVSRPLGPRTQIWCEKEFIDRAEYEFAETEKFLAAAEDICGPYVWGVYELLLLPPSFPYGGMENPCVTFVTPTLLAGDRSLADVIAHEISHSWTGNLVTNCNFEHFWLNEGFTVFVERKIQAKLYGNDVRLFSAFSGLRDLQDAIKDLGAKNRMTCLVLNLTGIDPDDSFSIVPYEKGHTFLFYLEELLGGPDNFDPFLKSYLEKFKGTSINTDDFKDYFIDYFSSNANVRNVDWDAWLNKPGMPPVIPNYNTSLSDACTDLCSKWVEWNDEEESPFSHSDLDILSPLQIREVLNQLLLEEPLSVKKLEAMENAYNFSSVVNCEVRYRWIRLCIRGQWQEQIQAALNFLKEQGRMKYLKPIYRDLYAWPAARQQAIDTFVENKPYTMHVANYTISQILGLESSKCG